MEQKMKKYFSHSSFSASRYQNKLRTQAMGRYLLHRIQTESTMKDARLLADLGSPTGTVVIADCQTKGQGRKGRIWSSRKAENLLFTFFVRVPEITEAPRFNFSVPLAVLFACKHFGLSAGLKWPNDVLVQGKKICGTLLDSWNYVEKNSDPSQEPVYSAHWILSIGVGVNINQDMSKSDDQEVQHTATSLATALGKEVSREEFLAAFFNSLETELLDLSWDHLLVLYNKYHLLTDTDITVAPKRREDLTGQYTAHCIGLSPEGYLRVLLPDGKERTLIADEVMVRPQSGSYQQQPSSRDQDAQAQTQTKQQTAGTKQETASAGQQTAGKGSGQQASPL
eukprot:gb/GEZN01006844.1/.p1 GENE.gb/GEZN01006844.1/~~gb/GEZN01006844.1/.p1  ORF type:complete len:339 (+),score=54.37 gb/GEZN01006844.1/:287-1303(+)